MDCAKVQEHILDAVNAGSAPADLSAHLAGCADCNKMWQAMQASSAALNEWTAPEPSPYFNTRFSARLAEVKREEAAAPRGIFGWLRSPVSAFHSSVRVSIMAAALVVAVAVGIYQRGGSHDANMAGTQVSPAVNDLQKLDKDEDLYADFEMLDDLQTPNSQPAATTTNSGAKSEL